jgi:hypothetical protein
VQKSSFARATHVVVRANKALIFSHPRSATNNKHQEKSSHTNKMRLNTLLFSALAVSCADAFQLQNQIIRVPTKVFATVSLERTAQREVGQFQEWAGQCGVQPENGFCLVEDLVEGNEEWYAATATGGAQGSRVLYVPNEMILSSARIAQEYQGYVEPSFQVLESMGVYHLNQQFYLFLKILIEYESGAESPYYPWMAALPRKWDTAASMDDFCLSCLPPFIKSLCQVERNQLAAFREALQAFEYLSPESKADEELAKFAYNVVFTRSWPAGDAEHQIIPVADMLNHGYPANVALSYDQNGGCEVILTENVAPGEALHLSYGQPTNPSRFLATFGFLNEAPATYCKILVSNPSQELKDVGYDPCRMLFDTSNGAISQEVWDVMLYSRLELRPEMEEYTRAFHQAHMMGDEDTKAAIHGKFFSGTRGALQRHVLNILAEIADLAVKMNSYDSSKHPRLPLLKKHNDMVTSTFMKVSANLDQMAAN